jgi:hypothetical protein
MYGIYSNGAVVARFAAPMTVRSNHPVFASDALNLSRQITRRTAQRWEIETSLEPLSSGAHELFVSLVANGHATPIIVIMPQNYGAIVARTGSSSPTASGSLGASSITVTGGNFIPKGTFVKSNSHSKIYMTTEDRNGAGSVGIYPPLRAAASGTLSWLDDVQMLCYWDMDTTIGMTFSDGVLMDMGTIKLVEAV